MRQTFSERRNTGKVSVLALPRGEEARAMKDDMGEQALTDAEGDEFKRMQVSSGLAADDLNGVPVIFFNVESDDARAVGTRLINQLVRMRRTVEERLFDLCSAVQDLIEHHTESALNTSKRSRIG
jgi:hypothetical protein